MGRIDFKLLLVSCLIVATIEQTALTKTIYVDDNANGANDGSSWNNAYNFLHDALAEAKSVQKPVEIKVAQGVYKPDQGIGQVLYDQNATFQLLKGVALKGGFGGTDEMNPDDRDVKLYETVLGGDLKGNDIVVKYTRDFLDESLRNDNSYCVVTSKFVNKTTLLDGFTITGGNRHGMYNKNGSPTLIECTFSSNWSECWGGGLCNENGNPNIKRCTFIHNSAKYGGGIWNSKGSSFITSCIFKGNSAKYGGAIYNYDNSNLQIYNCIFNRNSAKYGVGIYNNNNCRPTVTNCTFTCNLADRKGGVIHNIHYSCLTLTNSILWNNAPDEHDIVNYAKSSSTVSYCNVQDGRGQLWFGKGCIDADPLFADTINLRLLPDSPCIDTGDYTAVPFEVTNDIDRKQYPAGNTVDMGAVH